MNKVFLLLIFFPMVLFLGCSKEEKIEKAPVEAIKACNNDFSYYSGGKSIFINPSLQVIYVKFFNDSLPEANYIQYLEKYDSIKFISYVQGVRITIMPKYDIDCKSLSSILKKLNQDSKIRYAIPLFYFKGSTTRFEIFDEVLAAPKKGNEENFESIIKQNNLEIIKKTKYNTYQLRVKDFKTGFETLDIANWLYEREETKYSHPNFRMALNGNP